MTNVKTAGSFTGALNLVSMTQPLDLTTLDIAHFQALPCDFRQILEDLNGKRDVTNVILRYHTCIMLATLKVRAAFLHKTRAPSVFFEHSPS